MTDTLQPLLAWLERFSIPIGIGIVVIVFGWKFVKQQREPSRSRPGSIHDLRLRQLLDDTTSISAPRALASVRETVALAETFAAANIIVGSLYNDWHSGQWSMELRGGGDYERSTSQGAVRIVWEELQRTLTISISPVERNIAPHEWQPEFQRTLADGEDPIAVAREHILAAIP